MRSSIVTNKASNLLTLTGLVYLVFSLSLSLSLSLFLSLCKKKSSRTVSARVVEYDDICASRVRVRG